MQQLLQDVISIHSLHTEGDSCNISSARHPTAFQSTPSTRRETPSQSIVPEISKSFQSTPSTRRETSFGEICAFRSYFNPLPPHGGRLYLIYFVLSKTLFQSTPSTRRETGNLPQRHRCRGISIHSLHTEGDVRSICRLAGLSPFQSTPSTRRETARSYASESTATISIHSLHTEGDSGNFMPT